MFPFSASLSDLRRGPSLSEQLSIMVSSLEVVLRMLFVLLVLLKSLMSFLTIQGVVLFVFIVVVVFVSHFTGLSESSTDPGNSGAET